MLIKDSNKIAMIERNGKEVTYHTLLQKIHLFSLALDVQENDRVFIISEPRIGYAYALFAIWEKCASYTTWFHNVDATLWTWAIDDIKPKAIFVSSASYQLLKEALKGIEFDIQILLIDELEKIPATTATPIAQLKMHKTAILFRVYTAGITDKHKPIELSLTNVVNTISQLIKKEFYKRDDNVLVLLPFYNNWILISTLLTPLTIGATCVFVKDEIHSIIDTVSKYKVSILVLVKRIYDDLLNVIFSEKKLVNKKSIKYKLAYKIKNVKLSNILFKKVQQMLGGNIRYFLTVGAKLEEEIYNPLLTFGFEVFEGYGMAEASSLITYPESKRTNPESVGKILDTLKYKIINGELILRGDNIGRKYYNRDILNRKLFNNDWFFTQDIVEINNDGLVKLHGRLDDKVILKSGRIIIPAEIDKLLDQYKEFILESGSYVAADKLKVVIIPTPAMVEQYGKENNYLLIHSIINYKIIEHYNLNVPYYKRIHKVTISEQQFSRSTSGKIKRYLLQNYENTDTDL